MPSRRVLVVVFKYVRGVPQLHLTPLATRLPQQVRRGPTPTPKPHPATLTLTLTLPCPGFGSEFAARTNIVRKPGATDVTKTVRMLPGRVLKCEASQRLCG